MIFKGNAQRPLQKERLGAQLFGWMCAKLHKLGTAWSSSGNAVKGVFKEWSILFSPRTLKRACMDIETSADPFLWNAEGRTVARRGRGQQSDRRNALCGHMKDEWVKWTLWKTDKMELS